MKLNERSNIGRPTTKLNIVLNEDSQLINSIMNNKLKSQQNKGLNLHYYQMFKKKCDQSTNVQILRFPLRAVRTKKGLQRKVITAKECAKVLIKRKNKKEISKPFNIDYTNALSMKSKNLNIDSKISLDLLDLKSENESVMHTNEWVNSYDDRMDDNNLSLLNNR